MTITQENRRNGALSRQGKLPKRTYSHLAKKPNFELFQNELGEWHLRFTGSEIHFPATDVEVTLWLRVKELEEKHND